MKLIENVNKGAGKVFSYMRWSSEPQGWGDSERRQARLAKDWCRRNGKTLYDKPFVDRGVSAWRGANRQSGALAALLRTVSPGDVILIEDNVIGNQTLPPVIEIYPT